MASYVIADTHFFHTRVIELSRRPFHNVDEMHHVLAQRWNERVGDGDEIWVLGDFAFGGEAQITSIVAVLRGEKRLVRGNHDRHGIAFWHRCGFRSVFRHPVVAGAYLLSHEPVLGDFQETNIHGHSHRRETGLDPQRYRCVSVERTGYAPVLLQEQGHLTPVRAWTPFKAVE